jgi:hypothetical protein
MRGDHNAVQSTILDRIRAHVETKMAAAVVETSPSPHIVIENFFPDDVYAQILASNPFKQNRGEEWLSKASSSNVSSRTPYFARKQINFHKGMAFDASPEQRDFWTMLKDCFLADDWFVMLAMMSYPDYFTLRFGDLVHEADFCSLLQRELFLQRHEPGYYIGPHTDIPTRIFTCIFSFAEQDGFEEFGTQFLAHKDRLARCWGNDHYAPDNFIVRKIAPYKPNNFLLFFKTRHSFHAVQTVTDDVPNQRYGMQFQLYEPAGGLFDDLSVPDLMQIRHKPASTASRLKRLLGAGTG